MSRVRRWKVDAAELRAEIERRKKRAQDLKLPEVLWSLHGYLRCCDSWSREGSEWLYPHLDPKGNFSNTAAQFRVGESAFELNYKETRVTRDSYGGRNLSEMETADGTLGLVVDGEHVFDCDVRKITTYTEFEPMFDERLGEVTRFIEGTWIKQITDLLEEIKAHQASVSKKYREAYEAKELEAMKKRFGL